MRELETHTTGRLVKEKMDLMDIANEANERMTTLAQMCRDQITYEHRELFTIVAYAEACLEWHKNTHNIQTWGTHEKHESHNTTT